MMSPLPRRSWFEAIFERVLERVLAAWVERAMPCYKPPALRARWVNPQIVALTQPLEVPMQTFTTTQPADTAHGYMITTANLYTDGAGEAVAVDPASVAITSSDEAVLPVANVRYLGINAETGLHEIWMKPLNSAAEGSVARITGSALETGDADDWYIDYTVGADRLFANMDGASIAEASAEPA